VRNRAKIVSRPSAKAARAYLAIDGAARLRRPSCGISSMGSPLQNRNLRSRHPRLPAETDISIPQDLQGVAGKAVSISVGPTIVYAFMQAVGMDERPSRRLLPA
jgi:3-methyladenine DNA glycosylase Tag